MHEQLVGKRPRSDPDAVVLLVAVVGRTQSRAEIFDGDAELRRDFRHRGRVDHAARELDDVELRGVLRRRERRAPHAVVADLVRLARASREIGGEDEDLADAPQRISGLGVAAQKARDRSLAQPSELFRL
ncbi:MAG: hypothetical protein HOO96_06840, partial [Polyangiaceae bacterium]|nr:hypothetical protein [Polyangiaceae bacterium]